MFVSNHCEKMTFLSIKKGLYVVRVYKLIFLSELYFTLYTTDIYTKSISM